MKKQWPMAGLLALSLGLFVQMVSTQVQAQKRKPATAAELATQYDEAKKRLEEQPEDPKLNLEAGKIALRLGRHEESIAYLQKASAAPSRETSLLLSLAYGRRGDTVNQIRILESQVAKEPKDAEAYELLGKAYAKSKKTDESSQAFRKSFAIDPKRRSAYNSLLELFLSTKNNYESRTLLAEVIKKFGPDPRTMTELCRIYTEDSFLANAIETCRKATELAPKVPENFLNLGIALKNSEKVDEATKLLVKTANDFPNSSNAQRLAGAVHDEIKNWETATHFYTRCTKADKNDSVCWARLGVSDFELGRYPQSLAAFKQACLLNPRNLQDFKRCASTLRGRKQDALADEFQTAIETCGVRY